MIYRTTTSSQVQRVDKFPKKMLSRYGLFSIEWETRATDAMASETVDILNCGYIRKGRYHLTTSQKRVVKWLPPILFTNDSPYKSLYHLDLQGISSFNM